MSRGMSSKLAACHECHSWFRVSHSDSDYGTEWISGIFGKKRLQYEKMSGRVESTAIRVHRVTTLALVERRTATLWLAVRN